MATQDVGTESSALFGNKNRGKTVTLWPTKIRGKEKKKILRYVPYENAVEKEKKNIIKTS